MWDIKSLFFLRGHMGSAEVSLSLGQIRLCERTKSLTEKCVYLFICCLCSSCCLRSWRCSSSVRERTGTVTIAAGCLASTELPSLHLPGFVSGCGW